MDSVQKLPTDVSLESSQVPAWLETATSILRNVVLVAVILLALSVLFGSVLSPALESVNVEEELTSVLADLFMAVIPVTAYFAAGIGARRHRKNQFPMAFALMLAGVTLAFAAVTVVQNMTDGGSATEQPSLQFTGTQTDDGILIEAIEPGGTADAAGLLVGDIVTAIRRDPVTLNELNEQVLASEVDTPFRLRLLRDGEEIQLTVRTALVDSSAAGFDFAGLAQSWLIAVVIGSIGLVGPAGLAPYVLLVFSLVPLMLGYTWLVVATFSYRTQGLTPVDANNNFGGWTLSNWEFLNGEPLTSQAITIWGYTFNSLVIAVSMTVTSLILCSMAGYALSRMEFSGRRFFLSLTLILHSFPAVTLLIPIYIVLINLGALPIIGQYIGFNSLGGIALVMVAFELPFGVWLMKGFFDNISWDMERSALIDGATRWRTFWEVILPQIRPGMLALGIFAFIGGWNAYLLPATFSIGTATTNLPVYINELTGDVSPVNWNQVAAVGIFQMIPILVIFIFAQEYLLNIYSGGTKGST